MSGVAVAAKRYAKALFLIAQEKGTIEEIGAQLNAVAVAIDGEDVRAFLHHPNIGTDTKIAALTKAASGSVSEPVLNTLQLLVERGRSNAIGAVATAYKEIADEALGRAQAQVVSAFALTPEQQEDIARRFSELTGKKVAVENTVDSSLLGGVRVRIGDTLYDGSLATKLANLERSFNNAR